MPPRAHVRLGRNLLRAFSYDPRGSGSRAPDQDRASALVGEGERVELAFKARAWANKYAAKFLVGDVGYQARPEYECSVSYSLPDPEADIRDPSHLAVQIDGAPCETFHCSQDGYLKLRQSD